MLNFKNTNLVFGALIGVALILIFNHTISGWALFPIIFTWLLIVAWGSTFIQSNFHFTALLSNTKISKNQIAITFDDGPNPEFTPKVLDLLKKNEAKATFFCVGKQIESYPEIFKKIIAQGHTVGNHTYSHDNWYGFFSSKKVISDLKKTNNLVKKNYSLQLKLYRPAFGVSNPNIKKAIHQLDLTAIGWNKRSLDTTSLSSEKIISRITNQLKKGDIILLHDTSDKSLVVLEQLLLFLQKKNLKSVTIDALFNISPYA